MSVFASTFWWRADTIFSFFNLGLFIYRVFGFVRRSHGFALEFHSYFHFNTFLLFECDDDDDVNDDCDKP